ncbi:MAG: hypothetical protein LCH61_14795 [Proteobacteria bacterium]|nr:hypothetical protein [Pseudomonadota bacterium]
MVIRYASDGPLSSARRDRIHAPAAVDPALAHWGSGLDLARIGQRCLARLRRRLIPMLIVAALPFVAAVAWQKVQPPQFEAATAIFVDPAIGRGGRSDVPADQALLDAHIRTILSRTTFQKAIEREKLAEDSGLYLKPTGLAALADTVLALVLRHKDRPAEDRGQAILRLMQERMSAVRSGEANLIAVTASASDARTAARLANAVAQTFVDDLVATSDKASGSDRARLMARADELRARLRDMEARLAQARIQNGLDPARGDQDVFSQLARARAATLDAKAKSDQIQKLMAAGKDIEAIADLVRSPSIERLRIQYNEAAAQEANFRTSLGPRHPAFLEAAEQAKEKRRLLMEGLRLAASATRAEWQAARDTELQLEKRAGADAAQAIPPAVSPIKDLERDVELARLAYDRQMRMVEAADGATPGAPARIVTKAAVPNEPVATGRQRAMKVAAAAAALLALLVLVTGRSPERSARPARPRRRDRPAKDGSMATADPAAGMPTVRRPAHGTPDMPPQPVSPADPEESFVEEITARENEFALQVTLVTATTPTPDKSRTALRLALAAARRDVRVLLMDIDDTDHGLSRRFGANPATATIELQGRRRLIVQAEIAPGIVISLIPQEDDRAAPANDTPVPRLLALAGNFDLVILDGPAMTGGVAERKLARTAQSVVVVVDAEADAERLAARLDVSADILRLVQTEPIPGPPVPPNRPAETPARPMSIVRLQQCA